MEKDKLIKTVTAEIKSSPASENIVNIFKAVLASIPIGASISSLMTDYIPTSKFKRMVDFTEKIADDLKRLQDKIETDYITTDEFSYLFEQSYRGVAQNYHKEKIESFRGILLNSALYQDVVQEEKEFFLNLLDGLSIVHLKILKFMAFPEDYLVENGISQHKISGGFRDIFRTVLPEFGQDISIIELAFENLFQSDLIDTDKSIFQGTTSAQGMQLLGNRVSDLGRRFIKFCKVP